MTCPVCGTAAVPGARFCFACGNPLPQLVGPSPGSAAGDAGTERRVVTVLFGDLSDFTSWSEDLDPERVGVVTDRVLASLAGIVGAFGGYVDKLTGDGIMAVFGAPTAHEDDAERAVRAAARMQGVVRRLVEQESGGGRRLGLRVGLNTGEVIAGVQAHLSYTVIGDTVNTAARLSDAAGIGAVLAGGDTAAATRATATWRALPALRLKGKRDPVPAYELSGLQPTGPSSGFGREAAFLGRDAQFGLLVSRLLDVVDAGVPRTVLVLGEAGVGKSRLTQELSRFAGELPGARVLWGRCTPYGEGRDLAPVADMVRAACGIGDGDDARTAVRRLARTLSGLDHGVDPAAVPTVLLEPLRRLLGVQEPESASPREGAPGGPVAGDRVRRAVATLFTALGQDGPLLLVLDDLHWATPALRAGLLEVAEQTRGCVLLLAVGREDALDADGSTDWWRELPGVEVLALAPLDDAVLERLLRAHLGGRPAGRLDEQVRDALLRRAQGNPFFLAELLNLLVDRAVLRREGSAWVLDEDRAAAADWQELLPAGVQAVLAARIDGLDGAAKGVLRDASVLGAPVTLPALTAVGRASGHGQPGVVRAAATDLVQRRLLEETDERDGEPALRFGHTLVRDVAYAGLAKAERARRHAAAAAYAVQAGKRTVESDGAAASHGERAVRLALEMGLVPSDPAWQGRGIAYAALARLGSSALARDDVAGAGQVLRRALVLADSEPGPDSALPDDQVLPVRVAYAQALAGLDRLDEAETQLAPALRGGGQALRAGALVVLGEVRRKRADRAGAREAFGSALAAASAAGAEGLAGESLRQLGLLEYFDGRLRAAEQRFQEARVLAERVADTRGAAWALQHLAWSATTRGDHELAERALGTAAEAFTDLEDSGGLAWVAGTEALVRLLQGQYGKARALAGSLLPLCEALGERWGEAGLLVIDALAAAELGDVRAAADQARRARVRFDALGDEWGQAVALVAAAIASRGADQPGRAVTLLDEALRLAQDRHPVVAGLALVAGGYAHLDRGDLDGAQRWARRAGVVLAGLDLEPQATVGARVLLAQVLRRRGRREAALAQLDEALGSGPLPALLFPRRQVLSHRSGTLLELGREAEALSVARQAAATPGEDVRSRVMALRALAAALRAGGQGPDAVAALREALEVARSTGQRSELAATERALAAACRWPAPSPEGRIGG